MLVSQMSLNRDPDCLLARLLVLRNGWFNLRLVIYISYSPVCHWNSLGALSLALESVFSPLLLPCF